MFTGSVSPLHHIKGISIVTLSTEGERIPPLVTHWRPTLGTTDHDQAIIVDCDMNKELLVQRALLATRLRGLLLWDGPRRSLGKKIRLTFTGYFDARVVSDLDVQLYIRGLRSKAELHGALIGSLGLFNDRAALLMEFGHVSAVQDVLDSIDGIALVSPRLALISTPHLPERWSQILTQQTTADPTTAISCIRLRPSQHGGRPWAKPEILPSQLRSLKAKATYRASSGISPLRSTLRVSDLATGRREDIMLSIVQQMAATVQVPFRFNDGNSVMKAYDCKPKRDYMGHWEGTIEFECGTHEELQAIYRRFHNNGIEMSGTCAIVEVENNISDLTATPNTEPTTANASIPSHPLGRAIGTPWPS